MEIYSARYDNQKRFKAPRSKRFVLIVFAVVLAIFASGGYVATAFAKEYEYGQPELVQFTGYQPKEVTITWPKTGQAAFGTLERGVIGTNSDESARPIASITKLVTALTILKKMPMGPNETGETYTVTARDEQIIEGYLAKRGSVVPVRAGQKITQYDMMVALLLPSANNMADALAERAYGSMDKYLIEANSLVKSFGLSKTVISDASGFSPKSVSTPSELLVIAQKALDNPTIAKIMKLTSYEFPGYGTIKNSNVLLSTRPGVIGLKTGTTEEAGYCLLFAEEYGEGESKVTILGAVLGGVTRLGLYNDVNALLDSVERGFSEIEVLPAGTVVGRLQTEWGEKTNYVTTETIKTFGWREDEYDYEVQLETPSSAVLANKGAGVVTVYGLDAASNVVAETSIAQPDPLWRLQNVF